MTTLDDFIEDLGEGGRSVAIGVGSAGCRITSQLQCFNTLFDQYAYISCEERDLSLGAGGVKIPISLGFQGKASPGCLRHAAEKHLPRLERLISGKELVLVVTGLGGCAGSTLSPIVAQVAGSLDAITIIVAAMPYRFERGKHFYAGLGLRRLREYADGVIIIDNDELLNAEADTPLIDLYVSINERISYALNKIIASSEEGEFPIGMHKFLGAMTSHMGYSVFSMQNSGSVNRVEEAVVGAVRALYGTVAPDEAEEAILYLVGGRGLTPSHLKTSVSRLTALLGNPSLEVHYGFSTKGDGLTAFLLASGFQSTKFDGYDPLATILRGRELDMTPERTLGIELENLLQIE